MEQLAQVVLVGGAALLASTVAGVTGFGGAVLLLPVLVWAVGSRDAVVVLTVAQLVGNGSRVLLNRSDIDTAVLKRFALGAVPFALLGGLLFATTPVGVLTRLLGAFLLASVAWRHLAPAPPRKPSVERFAVLGAVFGFLSAILGSVGPVMAPFFLAYGLLKAAYIGTEAACTIVMHTTKLVAYGGGGVLGSDAILAGIALAPAMVAGSWFGKRLLGRIPEHTFVALIEVVLAVSGILLLVQG
jgi:uncharacterized membrane protein YfcA